MPTRLPSSRPSRAAGRSCAPACSARCSGATAACVSSGIGLSQYTTNEAARRFPPARRSGRPVTAAVVLDAQRQLGEGEPRARARSPRRVPRRRPSSAGLAHQLAPRRAASGTRRARPRARRRAGRARRAARGRGRSARAARRARATIGSSTLLERADEAHPEVARPGRRPAARRAGRRARRRPRACSRRPGASRDHAACRSRSPENVGTAPLPLPSVGHQQLPVASP